MDASEGDAREMLQSILCNADDTSDGYGDAFRLLVSLAAQWSPAAHGHADQVSRPSAHGGLATWQLRKAQSMMTEASGGRVSMPGVARACGLSHSHFNQAFKISVGMSPRQWLAERRIERAKWLLINTEHTLANVALACGFSEQCHFTRMFTRSVGMAPGVWRRTFGARSELWCEGVDAGRVAF